MSWPLSSYGRRRRKDLHGRCRSPFLTDGIESALEQAKAAAGDKDVAVMGRADIGQQYVRAGLVDEISIHLVSVLFGGGTRMFEHLGSEHIQLETAEVIETPTATHLLFRVVKED